MKPSTAAERARVNKAAGKARAAELRGRRARKADREAERDDLHHKRLAHNPLGPDDPSMTYWRTKDGAIFAEARPTLRVQVKLLADLAGELESVAKPRGESLGAYAARILAGHARGLRAGRSSRNSRAKLLSAPDTAPQQIPGQDSIF